MRGYGRLLPWVVSAMVLGALLGGARRARSQTPAPNAPRTYVGSAACEACHSGVSQTFAVTMMGRILLKAPRNALEKHGCESCHGPGSAHILNQVPGSIISFGPRWTGASVKEMDDQCVQCHRKGETLFWQGCMHQRRKVACVKCHIVMHSVSEEDQLSRPTQYEVCGQCHPRRKAQLMRSSHMPVREGKVTCGDCHNPHGSPAGRLIRGESVNDMCYSCHPDRRGPFLWEHAPVRENCLNCHSPHGSIQPNLLKIRRERLCQTCHIENRHNTQPHGPLSRFNLAQSCNNCHSRIHGSNHPAGELFLR